MFKRFILLAVVLVGFSAYAYADIFIVQPLSFGEFLFHNNDAQYDILLNPSGAYSYDSAGFVEISRPNEGIYEFDGFTPYQAITSVIATEVSDLRSGGWSFEIVNPQVTYPGNVNGDGILRVNLGATARSSGDGTLYPDRTYSGVVNIQINY